MVVTPQVLAGAYDFLRGACPIFKTLPPSSEVEFTVTKSRRFYGTHSKWVVPRTGAHRIAVSARRHAHLVTVLQTVAHEMCHQLVWPNQAHGPIWRKPANDVCAYFGWDHEAF